MTLVKLQMGKQGLTPEFIENLKKIFVKAEHVRVSVLKTATRDKEEMKRWSEEIINQLGPKYTCNIVGYTLILRKWRKAR